MSILLISDTSLCVCMCVWVIKELPQYSVKLVFQRRAKLATFTMNGKSSTFWWRKTRFIVNLQRLSILAKWYMAGMAYSSMLKMEAACFFEIFSTSFSQGTILDHSKKPQPNKNKFIFLYCLPKFRLRPGLTLQPHFSSRVSNSLVSLEEHGLQVCYCPFHWDGLTLLECFMSTVWSLWTLWMLSPCFPLLI
jgi:hypothetical protein